ncbi:MAG: hypothetical protein WB760_02780 [Xanthobacteraceae bacterium]
MSWMFSIADDALFLAKYAMQIRCVIGDERAKDPLVTASATIQSYFFETPQITTHQQTTERGSLAR